MKTVKLILAVIALLALNPVIAKACVGNNCKVDSVVLDSNDGNKGNIFVKDCERFGSSVGKWVDVKDVSELKGEKGDTGVQGIQGIQGVAGNDGKDGSDANVTHRYTKEAENKIANYGYNDYYSENAFKNSMIKDGYSKVYDSKVKGLDLVEVGYFGKTANPKSWDADYVLREEYEKYSAQHQDIRIDENKSNININKTNISKNLTKINRNTFGINSNKIKINNVDKKHTMWNMYQDYKINKNSQGVKMNSMWNMHQEMEINDNRNNIEDNSVNINKNKKAINKETKERKQADKKLNKKINKVDKKHTEWNEEQDKNIEKNAKDIKKEERERKQADRKEAKARKKADRQLQRNINKEEKIRKRADRIERLERIEGDRREKEERMAEDVRIDTKHTEWNENQDNRITNNSSNIADNSNRLNTLEETQYVAEVEGRVFDSRKWTVAGFVRYNGTRNMVDVVGTRITFKFGKSYEEKRLEKLEEKLNMIVEEKGTGNVEVVPCGDAGLKIKTSF